ncbi:NUDIX hydrolase [Streptomyces rimosus]|nr:NUDIX hydrolase [Streptomyces rimosus]
MAPGTAVLAGRRDAHTSASGQSRGPGFHGVGLPVPVRRRGSGRPLAMPGGGPEPGESPRQAAERELREETG